MSHLTHYIIWRKLPLGRCDGVGLISDDARKKYTDCVQRLEYHIYIYLCCELYPVNQPKMFSVQFSHSVVSDSFRPHGLQHARLPWACSNSCPSNRWCHPIISSSVVPFSSCLQSCPASGSFPMSQFLASSGQSIGVSASTSVLPINIQDWFPLGLTGPLQFRGLSSVFSNTTVQKHQFFSAKLFS